ncbi:hypothetical protein QYE76_045139 [Lolium multiflorum]|uniref:Auxin-responsive protein n=1 Tax=Lolium multiflorum TaxID=4521 RepID=A0AAD8TKN4_LOLMU|nr:hypothetical protein QYE76_045139 [Lolium multiflorum]
MPPLRQIQLNSVALFEGFLLAFNVYWSVVRKPSAKDRITNGKADCLQDQEYVLTYEDKDDDWMLVAHLRWEYYLYYTICRKLKSMRGSDAAGIGAFDLYILQNIKMISKGSKADIKYLLYFRVATGHGPHRPRMHGSRHVSDLAQLIDLTFCTLSAKVLGVHRYTCELDRNTTQQASKLRTPLPLVKAAPLSTHSQALSPDTLYPVAHKVKL